MTGGILAILALSYLFGHGQLEGALYGNDIPVGLLAIQWYDRWFPRIPIWFPLQGAGTCYSILYSQGANILTVVLHRLSGLTTVQAFRLLGFLSVPITATGIYFVVWRKLRNQTAGLVGGLFYLLSSGSWDWLVRIGLYAQSVSIMFFPWAFLLFDSYLSRSLEEPECAASLHNRLAFAAAASMFALLFLLHPRTAVSFSMAIALYALMLPFFHRSKGRSWRMFAASLLRAGAGVAVGLLLAAFWVVPLIHANGIANREGLSYNAWHSLSYYDFAATLALIPPPNPAYRMTFAVPVLILGGVGLVAGLIRRKAPFAWAVVGLSSVLFVAMPGLWPGLVRVFAFLWQRVMDRPVLIALVLLPAAAAYGALAPVEALLGLPELLLRAVLRGKLVPRPVRLVGGLLRSVVTASLTIAFAVVVVLGLEGLEGRNGYGPESSGGRLPIAIEDGELVFRSHPLYTLSTEGDLAYRSEILSLIQALSINGSTRLDVSPNLGGIVQRLGLYSDASMVTIYNYQASLIHAKWGYQQGLFYGDTVADPQLINVIAEWFGIQYVLLDRDLDSSEKYSAQTWPVVYPSDAEQEGQLVVRRFTEAPSMASILRAPTVLVIGGYEDSVYGQVFRTFAMGGIGYEEALLVEGDHYIDNYSLEELNQFDVVLLHGYDYRSGRRAWSLLQRYVDGGGGLYVDTGWQYRTPDWEMSEAPEVLPVENLSWTDLGMTNAFEIRDPSFGDPGTAEGFAPLAWEGQPWFVSSPSRGVRDWARPVLTSGGTPLVVAGEYGSGRVVWSGMNLIGHSYTHDNAAERELLRRLVEWLAPVPGEAEEFSPVVQRTYPDEIQFPLRGPVAEGTALLWREAYSPDWHASVEVSGRTVRTAIYRAGPGMMLILLPEIEAQDAVVRLEYSLGWLGVAGVGISLVTATGVAALVLFPGLLPACTASLWRLRRPRPRRGRVAWLPDRTERQPENPGIPVQPQEGEGPADIQADRLAAGASAWAFESQQESQKVKALLLHLRNSGRTLPGHDREAEQMMRSWRRSRPSQEEQDGKSGGEASDRG